MGFKFSIVSDVREVLRGNEAMEKGFEDTADSLDELAREAQRSGDKVGRELEGVAKEADTASDKVERKFRDAFREVERDAKSAGDDVGDRMKRGADRAESATDEFKDEAKQNFSEVASSFSGGIDGAADLVQGTLGGLAGSLAGPAGLAAGVLAGIGGAMFTSFQTNAENSEQRISDMYEDMKESGQEYLTSQFIDQAISDIVQGVEGAIRSYDQVKADAEAVGVTTGTMLRAWAGDQESVTAVMEAARSKQDELLQQFRSGDLAGADDTKATSAVTELTNGLTDAGSETDVAREKVDDYRAAIAGLPENKVTDMEVNTEPGRMGMGDFYRDIESARPTVTPQLDTADLDRQVRNYRPPRVLVTGEFEVRAGQRVV